jgi:hypothetical protein
LFPIVNGVYLLSCNLLPSVRGDFCVACHQICCNVITCLLSNDGRRGPYGPKILKRVFWMGVIINFQLLRYTTTIQLFGTILSLSEIYHFVHFSRPWTHLQTNICPYCLQCPCLSFYHITESLTCGLHCHLLHPLPLAGSGPHAVGLTWAPFSHHNLSPGSARAPPPGTRARDAAAAVGLACGTATGCGALFSYKSDCPICRLEERERCVERLGEQADERRARICVPLAELSVQWGHGV